MAIVDKSLKALIAALPNDGRRTIVLKLIKAAMAHDVAARERQQELDAKATPTARWLNSLDRVAKPGPAKK